MGHVYSIALGAVEEGSLTDDFGIGVTETA
jgi:hypothetical protein